MTRFAVILAGLADGWREPYDLSTSTSVPDEHQELLDKAINVGQLLRAGWRSQTYAERYWPLGPETTAVSWRRRKTYRR